MLYIAVFFLHVNLCECIACTVPELYSRLSLPRRNHSHFFPPLRAAMQECVNALERQSQKAQELLDKITQMTSLNAVHLRTAQSFSLADQCEWLRDIAFFCQKEYPIVRPNLLTLQSPVQSLVPCLTHAALGPMLWSIPVWPMSPPPSGGSPMADRCAVKAVLYQGCGDLSTFVCAATQALSYMFY